MQRIGSHGPWMHLATQSEASANGSLSLCLATLDPHSRAGGAGVGQAGEALRRGCREGSNGNTRHVLFALAEGGQDLSCSERSGEKCVYFLALLFS